MHYNQYHNSGVGQDYTDPRLGRIPVQDFPFIGTWTQATIGFVAGALVGPTLLKMLGIKF